ncbi:hypothetical protein PG984_002092 [Apiospora sp. TS-2023a]
MSYATIVAAPFKQEVQPAGHCTELVHFFATYFVICLPFAKHVVNVTYIVEHRSGQWFGTLDRTSAGRRSSKDETSLTQNAQS